MADINVDLENKNAEELLGQGIRAYIMQDYNTAVQVLSRVSELYVTKHGNDQHESLGEVYLYYGKSLLGLSREESEALGDAVPKNVGEDESDDDDEEVEENDGETNGEEENKVEGEETEKSENGEKNNAEQEKSPEEPSSSTDKVTEEGEKSSDEDATDLQLAWEVLELARKIFEKTEDKKNIAETLTVLGEVSLESGCFEQAINDLKQGLELQKSIYTQDSRIVAETLYKLGIAYSTNSDIDEAVKCFNESLDYLKNRIDMLEKIEEKDQNIEEEIKCVKDLVPEIEEKIVDMKSLKDEAVKKIVSSVLNPKPANGTSSDQQANNISHLVKRKRKLEDIVQEKTEAVESPAKKPSP